jgi:hypothetical protein
MNPPVLPTTTSRVAEVTSVLLPKSRLSARGRSVRTCHPSDHESVTIAVHLARRPTGTQLRQHTRTADHSATRSTSRRIPYSERDRHSFRHRPTGWVGSGCRCRGVSG